MKILITDTELEISGKGKDLLNAISTLISAAIDTGASKDIIEIAVEVGLMSNEEKEVELKKFKDNKNETIKQLKDLIKSLE